MSRTLSGKRSNHSVQVAVVLIVASVLFLGHVYARGPKTIADAGSAMIVDVEEYQGAILATDAHHGLLIYPANGGPGKKYSWAGHRGYFDLHRNGSTLILAVYNLDVTLKTTFDVINIQDPLHPQFQGSITVDMQNFGSAPEHDFDGTYLYIPGKIIDISDIAAPRVVSEIKIDRGSFSHVTVDGDKLYASFSKIVGPLQGAQEQGLRVYDISDRTNPVLLGETLGVFNKLVPYKNYLLTLYGGLQVLTAEDPNNVHAVFTLHGLPARASEVIISNTHALIPYYTEWAFLQSDSKHSGVVIVNLDNALNLKILKKIETRGFAQSAVIHQDRLYIADYTSLSKRRLSCIKIYKSLCL